ncbi:MAG: ABC transporter permease [Thermomicrobiales bacterium]|nr:ABC transporter permease [Thermomicrobiales bacterium]
MTPSALSSGRRARPAARRGSLFADTWVITQRDLRHWLREPWGVAIGWLFPVMTVLLFGGLFGGAMAVPGSDYFAYLIPGMFAMTMLFGLESTMMAVTTDAEKGVTDRFRSLPMNATAVVLGRCCADMLNSLVALAVMVATGLVVGWRWHNGWAAALAAFGLLLLLRFALLWVGVAIGLHVRGPQAVTAVQILVWPVGFLSSVFVDPASMPRVLGAVAAWNPLSITAAAARELFGSPGYGGTTWIAQHAQLMAIVAPLAITMVFLPLSARAYRNLSR